MEGKQKTKGAKGAMDNVLELDLERAF